MRALARVAAIVLAAGMCGAVAAQTTDRPISAESLIVRRSASGVETVTFLSKDPNFLFPPIGSVDDPSRPSNGTELSLFPQSQGGLGFSYGVTGGAMWKSKDGAVDEYHYRYPQGPQGIKSVLLKETKRIKVRIRGTSPPFSGPYGGFFVRLTTGSLRNCAFFDASTIRRDDGTRFEARDAAAPSVSDCESFPGATTTTTTLPYPPCTGGAGYPTCDGTCPGTDECGQHIEGGFQTCACFPAGVIPCAESGYPTCGGACFGGEVCQGFDANFNDPGSRFQGCACVSPTSSCDTSFPNVCPGLGLCPPGEVCAGLTIDNTTYCDCGPPSF